MDERLRLMARRLEGDKMIAPDRATDLISGSPTVLYVPPNLVRSRRQWALQIRILARQGESIRQISRRTGLSRNTVRRYSRHEQARRYEPPQDPAYPFHDRP